MLWLLWWKDDKNNQEPFFQGKNKKKLRRHIRWVKIENFEELLFINGSWCTLVRNVMANLFVWHFQWIVKNISFWFFLDLIFLTTNLVFCKDHCTILSAPTEKLLTFLKFTWLDLPEVSQRPRRLEPSFWVIGVVWYFFSVFLESHFIDKLIFQSPFFYHKKAPTEKKEITESFFMPF